MDPSQEGGRGQWCGQQQLTHHTTGGAIPPYTREEADLLLEASRQHIELGGSHHEPVQLAHHLSLAEKINWEKHPNICAEFGETGNYIYHGCTCNPSNLPQVLDDSDISSLDLDRDTGFVPYPPPSQNLNPPSQSNPTTNQSTSVDNVASHTNTTTSHLAKEKANLLKELLKESPYKMSASQRSLRRTGHIPGGGVRLTREDLEPYTSSMEASKTQSKGKGKAESPEHSRVDSRGSASTSNTIRRKPDVGRPDLASGPGPSVRLSDTSRMSYSSALTRKPIPVKAAIEKLTDDFELKLGQLFREVTIDRSDAVRELQKLGEQFTSNKNEVSNEANKLYARYTDGQNKISRLEQELKLKVKDESSQGGPQEVEAKWRDRNERLQKSLEAANDKLKNANETVQIQQEQLDNKRALWLERHPEYSAPLSSSQGTVRNPYDSPTAASVKGQVSSSMGSSPLPSQQSRSKRVAIAESQSGRRARNMPTESTALVLRTESPKLMSNAELANELAHTGKDFAAGFSHLFSLLEGWCRTYASIPNIGKDHEIVRENGALWHYMLNLAYPGHKRDSEAHVVALIKDEDTRMWFVMRMAITYCCNDMMGLKAWKGYSRSTDKVIVEVQETLKERGLSNEIRQIQIDRRVDAIKNIVSSSGYAQFKNNQINKHVLGLRELVMNMLSAELSQPTKKQAGRDLGVICVKSWELSEKMWTCDKTIHVNFPSTNNNFMAATMTALDRKNEDPFNLQVAQTRLKLIITPILTIRDDHGTGIQVKNLHAARVLTMQ